MYNFYRWYPRGKILFLAPTKPLVRQQHAAYSHCTGIPEEDTVVLSGQEKPERRRALWSSKRVFFATPQTIVSDITRYDFDAVRHPAM